MKSRLTVNFYLIGLVQLVLLLAPALLFSGPPPFGGHPPPGGPPHGRPNEPFGIPPPALNFLCGFVVIAVGSWLTSRWIRTPLEKLANAAHRLAGGDLKARVAIERSDELGVVGAAFDNMAVRLEHLVRAEKELLANVSHELRTPLARIRVALTLAAEGDSETTSAALGEIGTDVAEITVLLDRIFTAARLAIGESDAPVTPTDFVLARERLAPKAIAMRAVERFQAHHPARAVNVAIAQALIEDIDADPVLLGRALGNLLENADKYSVDASSPIDVRVTAEGDDVVFEVTDRGVGVAKEDLPRLFEPFFRGRQSRASGAPGVGLGLALVKRIAEAHGGRAIVKSTDGEGTTAIVRLPVAR